MRLRTLKLFTLVSFFSVFSIFTYAQHCFNTGLNGSVITLSCNQSCVTVPIKIPHLKSSSDYIISSVPYLPFTYVTPGGSQDTRLYNDDAYSSKFALPFPFCFFDSLYEKVVIGSNGLITFDEQHGTGSCDNAYSISPPIPAAGGGSLCSASGVYYPRASIMGCYTDLDPRPGPDDNEAASPADRKIEWRVEGSAPCRRFVISFFHVGSYGTNACNQTTPATFQIVIYESTGIIEVFIANKSCNTTSSGGRAILGIQNWYRDKAVAAPGKNATVWRASNEGYRFTPSGGVSRFKSCDLYDINGNFIVKGDTITTTQGMLDVTFPSFCPSGSGTQYIIRTTFTDCQTSGTDLESSDTITVNRNLELNATAATTQTSCGPAGNGTATVTVPAGIGTAPYTFVLNPGGITQTSTSGSTVFNGLSAGSYTVAVNDAGGCSSNVPVTIASTGTLSVSFTTTNTTCVGADDGSIVVNPPVGTPPILYSINGGAFGANNVFSNLAPGTYFMSVHDNAGCQANFVPVSITAGPPISMNTAATPTSCPGANNGTITITGATGTPPYQYSMNGGSYQAGNVFSGLAPGTYFISLKDAKGCSVSFTPVTVTEGSGTVTGTATGTATSCSGATDGSISVTPSGTGPFDYSIDNGTNWQTGNTFGALAAGNYTILIREAGMCRSNPIPVTIAAGAVLAGTVASTPTACAGVNNGTVTVTPANGSAPYQYALDGGTFQASATFTGVAAGNHNVVIQSAAGCTSANIPVTVAAGAALTANAAPVNTSCSGATDGTITIAPTNGSAPYEYSLDGGAYQTSATFTGIAAGAHNVKFKDNFGCISPDIPVTVTAGPQLSGTAASTATACAGVNNGTIIVTTAAGFTGPFEYSIDGGTYQSSATFTGVMAGAHTVKIRNTSGCVSADIPVSVAAGSTLAATASTGTTSCSGAVDGTITVTPTNGSAPYEYSLDGGAYQTSATFTGIAAGAHNVKFKDNFGCISPDIPVTVTAGPQLSGTAASTATACAGVNNGTITVTAAAGFTGPFEYSLNGGAYQSSNTFTGIAAGTHAVSIRNTGGCISAAIPVAVTAGPAVSGTIASSNTSCSGAADGTITVTPVNGTAPYQYSLDGGAYQSAATFTAVAAGAHSITVRDNFGCLSAAISAPVTAGPVLTGTATAAATACASVSNGTITVTPAAGFTGPFEYALNGGTYQSSNAFTGLAPGNYTVKIRNTSGCISADIPVNVTAGAEVSGTIASANTSCSGATDGTITVTPLNGTAPYQYSLDGGAYQSAATFTAVAAGAHTITVRDNFGCLSAAISAPVTAGPVLTGTATAAATACASVSNGTITVTPAAGFTGLFEYALNSGTYQSPNTFTGLAAGSYTVKIRNTSGCVSADIPVTVAAGAELTGTVSSTPATCNGISNGSVTVTPTNGTAPYQYALNSGTFQASNIFNGLAANTYTVVVKDASGCVSAPIPATVAQPAVVAATAPAVQNVSCHGGADGVITAGATGGTAPYSYSLDNITYQSSNTFNVPRNTYTVYVKDAMGCTAGYPNVIVAEPPALTASAASTVNATCNGGSDGVIEVTAGGGTPAYQYSLDGTSFQASNQLHATAGTYRSITVKDANGCRFVIPGDVVVGLTNNLTLSASNPAPICEGNSVQIQATGNATGYSWTSPSGTASLSDATIAAPVASPRTTTTYTVAATLGVCSSSANLTVTVLPAPIANAGPDTEICYGQDARLQGSGGSTYTWTPATFLDDHTAASPQVTRPLKTTIYSLQVTDANNCSSLVADNVTVTVIPPIRVKISPADTIVYAGAQYQLLATSVGTDYVWTPASGLNNPFVADPVVTAPMLEGAEVVYRVTASTAAGCEGEGVAILRVYKGPEIYVVTAFTPNKDGRNEVFIPIPVGIKQLTYFRVLNRWGQLIFSTNTLHKGWDGKWNGVEQPTDVYVWMVQGVTDAGNVITKKGTVTLIR